MTRNLLCAMLFFTLSTTVPALAADTRLEIAAFSGGHAVLTFSASPLYAMTEVPFAIELRDAKGQPVNNAQVSVSLDMPAMPMPKNSPAVVRGDGVWRGTAVFTMAGAWQALVDIHIPDGPRKVLVFDIKEVLIK